MKLENLKLKPEQKVKVYRLIHDWIIANTQDMFIE